jgi:tRNA-modifying protein YgfZ
MTAFWCEYPRDVVMVEGPDTQTFLHSQLSQDLNDMAVGDARQSLVLDPVGKVVALVRVVRSGDNAYVLDTDKGAGDALVQRLARFKIRVAAEITVIPWRCIALRATGDTTVAVPAVAGAVAVPAWFGDGTAIDLLGPAPQPPAGLAAGTPEALDTARIDAGWPALGSEIDSGSTLPATLGDVLRVAVSFTKGCYPGQELVERMDSRAATAPQTIRRVEVPAGTQPGDSYVVDGTEMGTITSVAGTVALALVRRGAVAGEAAP